MATKSVVVDVDGTVQWLKANPHVVTESINTLKLIDQRLSDAIAIRPKTLLDLANSTYKAAVAARAPKDVLSTLKRRRDLTKAGLSRLPKFAYAWLSICELRNVETKAKAKSILTAAALRSPDKANRIALQEAAKALSHRTGDTRTQKSLPCLLCCAIACFECGPFCILCCVIACLICWLTD